ncbi:DNA-binding PadR family transcriptional regulator [Clostridium saccharoperbutylacetonicum]|uniref:Transcriptional regulator, PadR family n=1 Tax=Clostridium saccharoperbutylacetonicum N1-4(HMT) TaxID=931276 RepID=M1MWQ6_9CLOT|nr:MULTISPECIES: PadR family transcriptional regulator [Clostridium]AGF55902.1 transcriptional regulator, PadR family [Clostridium saccharoperbutylacetonicum N1-4(HMT)]NRT63359.1 DNA-binding PadR family transcriptional regulator [Clostridium saccharoperbutylacetonicum]NSB26721.1 DNA-binding PadR family transcriptional regulator [Clostridium saccharoperbutylacetonicum]NSB46072.1 DNA-binding PadR family transcriptional regulator [Clostridium saccharoperbutylacetonicum]
MLEYIILGFLMSGEMSGYDLKQKMIESTSNFFDAGYGSIYPALKRMEAKCVISLREIIEGGKYKKLYAITELGKSEFLNWLELPVEFSRTKPDHLIKIFFFKFLPKEKAITHLKFFIKEVESFISIFGKYENQVKEQFDVYQFSTFLFGLGYYEYIVKYCNDLLNKLND